MDIILSGSLPFSFILIDYYLFIYCWQMKYLIWFDLPQMARFTLIEDQKYAKFYGGYGCCGAHCRFSCHD